MFTVIGTELCPDTISALNVLDKKRIPYSFFDITKSIQNLKYFMVLRDTLEAEQEARDNHIVGIPLFLMDDGSYETDLQKVLIKLGE